MGDMARKAAGKAEKKSLEEKAAERERRKQMIAHGENVTIKNIATKAGGKDKPISARVNGATYSVFKKICTKRGLSSNAALNMLIADFVNEYKHVLDV